MDTLMTLSEKDPCSDMIRTRHVQRCSLRHNFSFNCLNLDTWNQRELTKFHSNIYSILFAWKPVDFGVGA